MIIHKIQKTELKVSLHQEQFFVEEEPFAQRINTTRMATHFKKVGIESIAFQNNLTLTDNKISQLTA